jgi:hypothetical protein
MRDNRWATQAVITSTIPIPAGSHDPVSIRHRLLNELVAVGLLQAGTREDSAGKGYFFDHAVRRQIPMKDVKPDRRRAKKYESGWSGRKLISRD